ncbi:MAG: ABC transporter ATP-binding protein, partial [Nitrososphaerales archaeon]
LKVWENVALAHRGRMTRREATGAIAEIGERYGLTADANARVEELTVGQRQRVELVKCLSLEPEVLILDEPTSVLTKAESRELFSVLRQVVQIDGLAVILISHKLDEVLQATDVVTIMRDGSVVAELRTADADAHQLAKAMVGREVLLQAEMAAIGLLDEEAAESSPSGGLPSVLPAAAGGVDAVPTAPAESRPSAFRFVGVSARGQDGRLLLDELCIEVDAGEIVGVAGVDGNGQAAIGELMSGVLPLEAGRIEVAGAEVAPRAVALMGAGVAVIPEDRHSSGCVLTMSVEENLAAADLDAFRRRTGLLDRKAIRARARELIDAFGISCPSPAVPMSALSGGNQQRVVLARELSRDPRVVIAVQPTRGLDVGAIEYISEQLRAAAAAGAGILLISSELDELVALSHRIAVIHGGRIVGEMPRGRIDVERLGLLMGGRVA